MLPVSRQHFVPIDGYRNGSRYNVPMIRVQDCTWEKKKMKGKGGCWWARKDVC